MLKISTITCQLENEEILYIRWEDYDPFMKFNFEMYFFNLIEQINKQGIRKLILDCSARKHDPSERDFKEIYELFLSGLNTTGLQKMARIRPAALFTNANFDAYLDEITVNLNLGFQLCNFSNQESAFIWLSQGSMTYMNHQQSA